MRVLILAPTPPTHGVLHALVSHGVEPVVAHTRGSSSVEGLVRHEHVSGRGDPTDPMDLRFSRKALRTAVRDLRPDLLHIVADPWTPTAEGGAAAARHVGVPYVVVGTSSVGGARGLAARWQANRIRDEAAGLAGITRPALDLLSREAPAGPRAVLPHVGFTMPGEPPEHTPQGTLTLAVFGRIVPERGLDLLFDALAQVHGDWRLKLIGTGPAQEPLERQAQRLGLSSRIEWLGGIPREQLGPIWPAVDAVVAPSRTTPTWVEPTGSLILEAMARRKAVVVSRCGALPDVVSDAGLVVDEADTDALARAMARLVAEPEFVTVLGNRARQRALEHYGDGPVAGRTVAFWQECLKAQRDHATP